MRFFLLISLCLLAICAFGKPLGHRQIPDEYCDVEDIAISCMPLSGPELSDCCGQLWAEHQRMCNMMTGPAKESCSRCTAKKHNLCQDIATGIGAE